MNDAGLKVSIVMLGVADVERSISFFANKVGLASAGRVEDLAFFDAGPIRLCLSRGLASARRSEGKEAVEIVFGVASVRQSHERLRSKGVAFLSEPHTVDGTNHVANFEDPDGHLFSLFGPP